MVPTPVGLPQQRAFITPTDRRCATLPARGDRPCNRPTTPTPCDSTSEYPEEGLDRLKTLFRIILLIPIVILSGLVTGGFVNADTGDLAWLGGGGALFLPTLLMLLFRRKYPRWWFDWHLELTRFTTRVGAYVLLLREEYPSTDEAQAVHLEIDYPDAEGNLNRFLPIVKWLLAIPHYIVLVVLWVVAIVVTVLAWFAILITGRYPRPLFDFVLGVSRWSLRVEAYMWLLTTDRYPPFRLEP